MPKFSSPEPPTTPRLRPVAEHRTRQLRESSETVATATPAKAPDLTVNKVIAGAGAAATSAVLGSYFGAAGTVTGAALGSVASTISTVLYQRSLDRTRDTLVARIRITPGRRRDVAEAQLTLPAQRVAPEAETVRLQVEPDPRPQVEPAVRPQRPGRPWLWLAATVVVFAIGLLAVTGLEWAKGSTLTTGQSGTSVGRVITGDGGGAAPSEDSEPTEGAERSSSAEPSSDPTEEPTPTGERESGAAQTPEETEVPGLGTEEGADGSDSGRDDGRDDGRDTGSGNEQRDANPTPTPLLRDAGE